MRKPGLACVVALVACGGSDNTIIDGGPNDGTTSDVVPSDSGPANDSAADSPSPGDAGSDVTSDGGGFNPASIPNLVLWLEADVAASITTQVSDAGVTKVTKWADQTSHHNDAAGIAQFLTADPTLKSGAIHSLPTMHFDQGTAATGSFGQELTIQDNADTSLQWGTGDFLVAIVGDYDNDASKGAALGVGDFYSKTNFGGAVTTGVAFFGNVPGTSQSTGLYFATATSGGNFITTGSAYNNGMPHMFVLRRRGGTMDLIVDGTSVANAMGTNVDVTNAKLPTCIGAYGDPAYERLDGDIGEILAVKGVLAPSDEAGLVGYLKGKWATP